MMRKKVVGKFFKRGDVMTNGWHPKIAKVGIKKEKGFLYFVDKQGDISSAKMARGDKKGGIPQKSC